VVDSTDLASVRWPELTDRPLVVVPLGSLEQHGPHLPLGTDSAVAGAVATAAVASSPGALLAPLLAYGASGEHEGFPGTVSIGTSTLTAVLVEYGRSVMRWAGRLLIVNGHGGNLDALHDAVPLLRHEGRDVAWFACGVPGGDAHAGRTETSLMLHLDPAAARPDMAAAGETAPLVQLMPRLVAAGVRGVSPNGVLGDPAGASAEEGERQVRHLVSRARAALTQWQVDDTGRLAERLGGAA
jgi:mycofactocin system creatininase family protein